MAKLYLRNGEVPKSRELLRKLMDDPVRGQEAAMMLGAMLERNGEKDAAMLCYKKALAVFEVDRLESDKPELVAPEVVLLRDSTAGEGAKEVIPAV